MCRRARKVKRFHLVTHAEGKSNVLSVIRGITKRQTQREKVVDSLIYRKDLLNSVFATFAGSFAHRINIEVNCKIVVSDFELILTGLLIFRAVVEPRISSKSAKCPEIRKNTRNPAKFARNLTKYMSVQHI